VLHQKFNALAQRSANGAASLREIKVLADNTEGVLDSGVMQLDVAIFSNEPCKAMVKRDNDGMTGTIRELGMTQSAVNFH
jgi:hypothetical protein